MAAPSAVQTAGQAVFVAEAQDVAEEDGSRPSAEWCQLRDHAIVAQLSAHDRGIVVTPLVTAHRPPLTRKVDFNSSFER